VTCYVIHYDTFLAGESLLRTVTYAIHLTHDPLTLTSALLLLSNQLFFELVLKSASSQSDVTGINLTGKQSRPAFCSDRKKRVLSVRVIHAGHLECVLQLGRYKIVPTVSRKLIHLQHSSLSTIVKLQAKRQKLILRVDLCPGAKVSRNAPECRSEARKFKPGAFRLQKLLDFTVRTHVPGPSKL